MKQARMWAAACCVLTLSGGADGADVYSLDPVVVTAQRTKTNELHTPAAVEVLSAADLERTGATSVQEAVKFATGIQIYGQGPKNLTQGSAHNNKIIIRGVEKGTLVLVDGVPMNQDGRYFLNNFPTESVERVEIIRGGGAVLYGSEASGGVVNIITKDRRVNAVKASAGNYGMQNYSATVQAGDFGITYTYDKSGEIEGISKPTYDFRRGGFPGLSFTAVEGESRHVNWRYNLSKELSFTHDYGTSENQYQYRYNGVNNPANAGKAYKNNFYESEEHTMRLRYDGGDTQGSLFYHRSQYHEDAYTAISADSKKGYLFNADKTRHTSSDSTEQTLGLDLSRRWRFAKGSVLAGFEFLRDMETNGESSRYSRNMYSLYGQVGYEFTESTRADFNFRGTRTEKDAQGSRFSQFTPEAVVMHDVGDDAMLYVKVGRSFMMPTFGQLYGSAMVKGTPDLRPQKGVHYEIGWKKNVGDDASFRLAAYRYNIADSLEAKEQEKDGERYFVYNNEDVRNTGVELEWRKNVTDNFAYHVGVSLNHPEKRATDHDGNGLEEWHDYLGKYQFNGGVEYKLNKFSVSASVSVLAGRVRDGGEPEGYRNGEYDFKSQCFTNLHMAYQPNEMSQIFLHIDNVFNRHDIINTGTSTFYNLGRNFMLGYEYKW